MHIYSPVERSERSGHFNLRCYRLVPRFVEEHVEKDGWAWKEVLCCLGLHESICEGNILGFISERSALEEGLDYASIKTLGPNSIKLGKQYHNIVIHLLCELYKNEKIINEDTRILKIT